MGEINIDKIQNISIIISILFFLFIFELIRRKKIKEQYSLLWLLFAIFFIVISVWKNGLNYISIFLGIAYPPTAFFLIILFSNLIILIHFSILVSNLKENNKDIVQELGLLKMEINELKKELSNKNL